MQYALLIYGRNATPMGPVSQAIGALLAEPNVLGWARLHSDEAATTLRTDGTSTLLTDGPFIDSKEYLAGLIVIDVPNLDAALEVAQKFQDARDNSGAMEVRPIFEGFFGAD